MENKDWRKEFDAKFPCIETECDNKGTMVRYDREGDAEQQQCQYCYEDRLPIISFIESLLKSKQEEIEGELEKMKKEIDLTKTVKRGTATNANRRKMNYNQAVADLKPIISNILK